MKFDILNAKELKPILKNAPSGVIAAFNGHNHIDYELKEDGMWFINVNSMSCQCLDVDFIVNERYTKEIDEKSPNIKYTVPYKDSLYAIVIIDDNGIGIKGAESEFVGIDPKDHGFYEEGTWFTNAYDIRVFSTPSIKRRFLPLDDIK